MTILNPLFDPRSEYSRRRGTVDPSEKLHGYFHWLSELKESAPVAVPSEPERPAAETPLLMAARAGPAPRRRHFRQHPRHPYKTISRTGRELRLRRKPARHAQLPRRLPHMANPPLTAPVYPVE